MSDIVLSSAVRNNLLSLQDTSQLMDQTQYRLSTGKEVNSALDNPTNFFTAQSLDARAGDLNRLLDSVGNSVQSLEAADEGISAITDLVEAAQASARQAQQAAGPEIDAATTAGTVDGLDGTETLDDGDLGISDTEELTIDDGANQYTYTVADETDETVQDVIDDINDANDDGNLNVRAELSDDGELVLTATDDETSFTVGGDVADGFGVDAETYEPTITENNEARQTAEEDFNRLRTQIDELASDASFNGVNLLTGDDLTVNFNEDGSSQLTIEGVNFDSEGLGINEAATDSFQDDANVDAALGELDAAIGTLRAQASTFGSNLSVVESRENFTNNMVNTLETGSANLTLADTNEEGANMTALQTRQQLSTVSLSMASQADQNVLQLF